MTFTDTSTVLLSKVFIYCEIHVQFFGKNVWSSLEKMRYQGPKMSTGVKGVTSKEGHSEQTPDNNRGKKQTTAEICITVK